MRACVTLLILAATAIACDKGNGTSTTETTASTKSAPDNTKTNTRDNPAAITPIDQGNDRASLDTTQAIRKAVMADDSLSSDAKNVKIITNNGVITLRGPVKTLAEKRTIEVEARAAAGGDVVNDQIDVEPNQ